jgi:hypothetical protein
MVSALFADRADAQAAHGWLIDQGYQADEINVLMSDATRTHYAEHAPRAPISANTHAADGMGIGGAIGTAVGATLAAVAAIGTSLALPGLGLLVAGPLAAALAGGGAGAVTGGLIGLLVGLGIPEQNAEAYQEALREGGVILGVAPREDDADRIEEQFRKFNGEAICYC